jgi:hypothetical protein
MIIDKGKKYGKGYSKAVREDKGGSVLTGASGINRYL